MSKSSRMPPELAAEPEAIRAKGYDPSGSFVDFKEENFEQSIPDRFEEIVRRHSDRIAVKSQKQTLTYQELNQTANRIGCAILAQSGRENEPIALLFEHGTDAIAAIFGALKAGKFYVALDPSFPPHRNTYILEHSQAGRLITNNRNRALAHELAGNARAVFTIDELDGSIASHNLGLALSPETFLNICYTSGSTGTPKGIVQTHRHVLNFALQGAAERKLSIDDRLSLVHFVGFGSASSDLFQSLLNGASLFPFDIKSKGIPRLAKWLAEESITICHLPPAVFRQLAPLLSNQEKFRSLRLIYLSGAPVTQIDVELYKQTTSPGTLLHIGMGSTEAGSIGSAIVDHTFLFPQEGFPVGYPRPGNTILLLDENGRKVGPGQVGEIALKGRNLNPGYWRMPELTGAKFLPDPSGGSERIYLTGDLGRVLPDGFLIHLGRKDLMVKIRGYRVELAEIERALLALENIKASVVTTREDAQGEQRLVAYIVPAVEPAPAAGAIRKALAEKLPNYMVPSAYVMLEALPLTANGKVDRRALPEPATTRPELDTAPVAPRTSTEEILTSIWSEVLGVDPVGVHDNFLDLGGHSLLAGQLITRVKEALEVEIPLQSLWDAPTIAEMALAITQSQMQKAGEGDLHSLLAELEALPDGEAERLLADEQRKDDVE